MAVSSAARALFESIVVVKQRISDQVFDHGVKFGVEPGVEHFEIAISVPGCFVSPPALQLIREKVFVAISK